MIERIPKRATTILTNGDGQPWKGWRIRDWVVRVKKKAGLGDLHFHELRGNAATKFYLANLSIREIAEILCWQKKQVVRIISTLSRAATITR